MLIRYKIANRWFFSDKILGDLPESSSYEDWLLWAKPIKQTIEGSQSFEIYSDFETKFANCDYKEYGKDWKLRVNVGLTDYIIDSSVKGFLKKNLL